MAPVHEEVQFEYTVYIVKFIYIEYHSPTIAVRNCQGWIALTGKAPCCNVKRQLLAHE